MVRPANAGARAPTTDEIAMLQAGSRPPKATSGALTCQQPRSDAFLASGRQEDRYLGEACHKLSSEPRARCPLHLTPPRGWRPYRPAPAQPRSFTVPTHAPTEPRASGARLSAPWQGFSTPKMTLRLPVQRPPAACRRVRHRPSVRRRRRDNRISGSAGSHPGAPDTGDRSR